MEIQAEVFLGKKLGQKFKSKKSDAADEKLPEITPDVNQIYKKAKKQKRSRSTIILSHFR